MSSTELVPEHEPVEVLTSAPEREASHESVLALLLERQKQGYRRGIDHDGHKVGLTFDMGSYGGVISLSMASVLEDQGLTDYVDCFYGISSGGVNAAFVATGQTREGIDTYYRIMPRDELIKKGELFPPKLPRMQLGVLRNAITLEHPLNIQKLLEPNAPTVIVGVGDMDDGYHRNKTYSSRDIDPSHPEEFIDRLIEGCNYPVLARPIPKSVDGNRITDAGMSWRSAMEIARADGCTDILSLSNAPPLKKPNERSVTEKIFNSLIANVGQAYMHANGTKRPALFSKKERVLNPVGSYLEDLLITISGDKTDYAHHDYKRTVKDRDKPPYVFSEQIYQLSGANVERIYPLSTGELPSLLTPDVRKSRRGIVAGRKAVKASLKEINS